MSGSSTKANRFFHILFETQSCVEVRCEIHPPLSKGNILLDRSNRKLFEEQNRLEVVIYRGAEPFPFSSWTGVRLDVRRKKEYSRAHDF